MKINKLVKEAHANAEAKGFWDAQRVEVFCHVYSHNEVSIPPNLPEKIALIHSEVTEALEEIRKSNDYLKIYFHGKKPEGLPIELADIMLRVADLAGYLRIDLERAIKMKMKFNKTRPTRHGQKF